MKSRIFRTGLCSLAFLWSVINVYADVSFRPCRDWRGNQIFHCYDPAPTDSTYFSKDGIRTEIDRLRIESINRIKERLQSIRAKSQALVDEAVKRQAMALAEQNISVYDLFLTGLANQMAKRALLPDSIDFLLLNSRKPRKDSDSVYNFFSNPVPRFEDRLRMHGEARHREERGRKPTQPEWIARLETWDGPLVAPCRRFELYTTPDLRASWYACVSAHQAHIPATNDIVEKLIELMAVSHRQELERVVDDEIEFLTKEMAWKTWGLLREGRNDNLRDVELKNRIKRALRERFKGVQK